MTMYASDILSRVQALRFEVANLQNLNQKFAESENPQPFATRANGERRQRLKEIMEELSMLAKEKHP